MFIGVQEKAPKQSHLHIAVAAGTGKDTEFSAPQMAEGAVVKAHKDKLTEPHYSPAAS